MSGFEAKKPKKKIRTRLQRKRIWIRAVKKIKNGTEKGAAGWNMQQNRKQQKNAGSAITPAQIAENRNFGIFQTLVAITGMNEIRVAA